MILIDSLYKEILKAKIDLRNLMFLTKAEFDAIIVIFMVTFLLNIQNSIIKIILIRTKLIIVEIKKNSMIFKDLNCLQLFIVMYSLIICSTLRLAY
jgi:hypothetical protein